MTLPPPTTTFNPPPPPPGALPPAPPRKPETSGWAAASLVTALLGLGPIAVATGHIALYKIKRSAGWAGGKGLAIAGLVLGYLQVAAIVIAVAAALPADDNTTMIRVDGEIESGYLDIWNGLSQSARDGLCTNNLDWSDTDRLAEDLRQSGNFGGGAENLLGVAEWMAEHEDDFCVAETPTG